MSGLARGFYQALELGEQLDALTAQLLRADDASADVLRQRPVSDLRRGDRAEERGQGLPRIAFCGSGGPAGGCRPIEPVGEQRVDERLLGGEVPVNGTDSQASSPGHVAHLHINASFGEQGGSGVEDDGPVVPGIGPLPPAQAGLRRRHGIYPLLVGALIVRGLGMGLVMTPLTAAAFARLPAQAMPRASAATVITRQIGGSIGTALLAVILATTLAPDHAGGGFRLAFWAATAITALALIPAAFLTPAPHPAPRARTDQGGC